MRWIARHRREPEQADVCDFEVVGELRSDSTCLLLRGCDGKFYAMDPSIGQLEQLEPDDSWALDVSRDEAFRTAAPKRVVA